MKGIDSSTAAERTSDAAAMKSGPGPRLLSAQSAAKYLGVPYTTLRDWALRGHLPVLRAPQSRRMWFDRKDLDRIVDQWKERLA